MAWTADGTRFKHSRRVGKRVITTYFPGPFDAEVAERVAERRGLREKLKAIRAAPPIEAENRLAPDDCSGGGTKRSAARTGVEVPDFRHKQPYSRSGGRGGFVSGL